MKFALIDGLIKEAKNNHTVQAIENLVMETRPLDQTPIQPLYLALKKLPIETAQKALTLMTYQQRQALLDIDLWAKDKLDLDAFEFFVRLYSTHYDDHLRFEFARGVEFSLFLKARFNIWTFDTEDPMYPDHDNYFLTEDQLLLVEFHDSCTYSDEIRSLIRDLYTEMGVENAYTYLFKLVSEGHFSILEDEFRLKKGRLEDLGIIDYFDALELLRDFPSKGHLEYFVNHKSGESQALDGVDLAQVIDLKAIIPLANGGASIDEEISKVSRQDRFEFLHHNFILLINATLIIENALKKGPTALTRTSEISRERILLGLNFVKNSRQFEGSLFDVFCFVDLYRIGKSLVNPNQKNLRKILHHHNLLDSPFLGRGLECLVHSSLLEIPKLNSTHDIAKGESINSLEKLREWDLWCQFITDWAPLVGEYNKQLEELKHSLLHDDYYLNYDLAAIDFEAVILSQMIRFALGEFHLDDVKKLGLTVEEFKKFSRDYFDNNELNKDKIVRLVQSFSRHYSFPLTEQGETYFWHLFDEALSGLEFDQMAEEEFKYVGGPMLLNLTGVQT